MGFCGLGEGMGLGRFTTKLLCLTNCCCNISSHVKKISTPQTRDTLSIIGLFGFFLVPITAVATTLYNRRHPPIIIIEGEDTGLPNEWLIVLMFSFFSFCILFIGISLLNDNINQLESKMEKYQRIIDSEGGSN